MGSFPILNSSGWFVYRNQYKFWNIPVSEYAPLHNVNFKTWCIPIQQLTGGKMKLAINSVLQLDLNLAIQVYYVLQWNFDFY